MGLVISLATVPTVAINAAIAAIATIALTIALLNMVDTC